MPWMVQQTTQVVLAAVDGDNEATARAICEVGERYGGYGGYLLCCGLAGAIAKMTGYEQGEGPYGLRVSALDGSPVVPEQLRGSSADGAWEGVVAMRFVIAYLNDDFDQCRALFGAPATVEQAMELPLGLVALARAYGRHRLAEGRR